MTVARKSLRWVVLALGWMLLACAPVQSEDSTNQVRSATGGAREKASQERRKLPFAKGTLTNIDFLRHELKLKTADGVQAFFYTPRTYIFRDRDKVTVDKLKIGEIIAVRFNTDNNGISTIVRIKAYGPPTTDVAPPESSTSTNGPVNTLP
jgi:Cu/Ag efflux protein CusF